jgi:ferrous iron transport protein B
VNDSKKFTIALVGNPNCGKTSIFNHLTGSRQKVANFPGVTVEKRIGEREHNGYNLTFVDLPGTYSLTANSPDEKIARDFILNENPALVINIIDSGSLERSLYLTMQLIEMGVDVVLDLNMWDEAGKTGVQIDIQKLSILLGAPVVTTIGNRAEGIDSLLEAATSLIADGNKGHRHPPITYGPKLDDLVTDLSQEVSVCGHCRTCGNPRWLAVKLLEGDAEIRKRCFPDNVGDASLKSKLEHSEQHILATTKQDPEFAISEGRYGYVAGIIREVMKRPQSDRMGTSSKIDNFLTHRFWGFPIFMLIMWLIFQATFKFGSYPMDWIGAGVAFLQNTAGQFLPAGAVSDLIVRGILGGVGAVAVFLPNIVILFAGISILEDSGYMARAAFLMDRLMHFLGLHGKSFIPLLMGFGCNVPAIMATRTLESHRDRILTILLIPLMSCSARLPVYILFAGAFFGAAAGNVIFSIYLIGIAAAVILARLYGKTILRSDSTPFVMELPPYRWPTYKSIFIHMWERTKVYLRKMGGVILVASIILWLLGYFPRKAELSQDYNSQVSQLSSIKTPESEIQIAQLQAMKGKEELEYSMIGQLGKTLYPIFRPLGFSWEMGVSVLTGFFAKEIVVSTLGVLYQMGDNPNTLMAVLQNPVSGIHKLAAYAFMIFTLLYTPCIATIMAIKREIGNRWMLFSVVFQFLFAWLAALAIFQVGTALL